MIDDGVPPDILPDPRERIDRPEHVGIAQEGGVLRPCDPFHQLGQDAARLGEDMDHTADDHQGDEMGHVGDRLYDLLVAHGLHFIQQQGQEDGGCDGTSPKVIASDQIRYVTKIHT